MVGIKSSFFSSTFIPEDLQFVLVIAREGAEVGQHLNSRNGYSLMDS
jgi:hypothetical protein